MKRYKILFLLITIVFFTGACGGSGRDTAAEPENSENASSSDSTADNIENSDTDLDNLSNSESSEISEIENNFNNDIYRYTDISLYEGTYEKTDYTSDSCQNFFGGDLAPSININGISKSSLTMNYDGINYTFPGIPIVVTDWYYYFSNFLNYDCGVGINSYGWSSTYDDLVTIRCADDYGQECMVTYSKEAEIGYEELSKKSSNNIPIEFFTNLQEDLKEAFEEQMFGE